jgi:phosphoribosylaminoimidazole carboxylase (NCAIR synthetase)
MTKLKTSIKSIIILGGNPETGAIVQVANKMGLRTIVLDPYPGSPSKRDAFKSYDVDITNDSEIDKIIEIENPDGILIGVADPMVPFYYKICKRNNHHCYANSNNIQYLTSKSEFNKICSKFNILSIPSHLLTKKSIIKEPKKFPVIVKPIDSGAGVGMSFCSNKEEFISAVKKGLNSSIKKQILVEQFMNCDDMFAYFTFNKSIAYLSATADRIKYTSDSTFNTVCIEASYPSKHFHRFNKEILPRLKLMFKSLDIQNGVLMLQFFVDDKNFYAYDPGFRLQGEGPHIYLKHLNGFDHRELLISFSLNGFLYDGDFETINDPNFKNKIAKTIWVLLREGTIMKITGMELIRNKNFVIDIVQRFNEGDRVSKEMMGTERQVFARIYTVFNDIDSADQGVKEIFEVLKIADTLDNDMIIRN